ncbi:MAG: PAS domain-containing protein [Gammaproteobacteria bacterium]|nr:PAS domain-containing protein [Gammaproteobacteria bacterium]
MNKDTNYIADELREKLRQVENRYRTVLDRYAQATTAARVGVLDWNLRNNEFYVDPNLKMLLGYTDKEIPDDLDAWVSLIHPDDREPLITATRALIRRQSPDNAFEHRMQHKDGRSIWFMVRATVEYNRQDRPIRLLGTNTEITQRKQLEMSIQEAVSAENARISLNLHDGLGQELAGISFLLQSLENRLKSGNSHFVADVADIRNSLSDAIAHTRELARGLYPVPVGPVGIMGVLRKLADGTSRVFKVNCEVIGGRASVPEMQSTQSNQIYFIAQEAVNNAVRHGLAKKIVIECQILDEEFRMAITDDGSSPDYQHSRGEGLGLRIMVYRARNLGGDLTIQPNSGGGTKVICRIPLKASPHRPRGQD